MQNVLHCKGKHKQNEKTTLRMRKKYFHKMLSCPTLCDPMDCSPPGSCCVQEIFQARILEWVAIAFCRGSSHPRDRTRVSCTAGKFFTNSYLIALSKSLPWSMEMNNLEIGIFKTQLCVSLFFLFLLPVLSPVVVAFSFGGIIIYSVTFARNLYVILSTNPQPSPS